MRLKTLFLLFGLILCTTALVNCSRESSIKENVNLRNNHSVVFVYKTPFENPDAFADSIINLPNPDSVIVSDTVTVTIGDTIHMMGFLRYNSDKIYLYQWILDSLVRDTSGKGKDKMKKALVTGHNATPQSWVYMKEGVYSPLFVAVDGNSATDTAGKDQFIRVINTPPYLGVPKDTLWTRAKSPISFPILALDSFGTITSFKVDVDASGKRDAKDWKYTKSESSDSLIITIPYDSTLTDSLGNQKIYIIVTDDDKNTTKDSVLLHFNQLPTIKILGPDDQQRISDTVESFRLFYEGHDRDNEDQLRYYVRVAATPDNQDDDLNLSNVYDLVLKNSASTSFAVIENGENALKNLGFTGRYFSWDVWVTDGYDTVVVEKIKTSKGKRPRFFYLGPGKSTCDFIGIAKFEGLSAHSGIKITLVNTADTNNIYTASTNSKGEFRVSDLPAGTFKLIAEDETGRGFVKVTTRTPNINAGDEKELPPILLKDPAPPRIYNIKGFEDTLAVRAWTVSGRFSDYGSQVKTAVAMLGKDTCGSKNSPCKFSNLTSYAWSVDMSGLSDGNYSFKITATDSAGYHSDTTFTFVVSATNISITVNNASSAMVGDAGTLTFKANVAEAKPAVSEVTWKTNVPGDSPRTISVSEGVAQIQLQKKHFPNAEANTRYTMQAIADNGAVSNIVRFGFYSDGPMVNIDAPAYDTTITLNDEIALSTTAIGNNSDATNDYTLTWICVESSTATENCFAANNLTPTKAWTTAGVKKIIAKVTNNDSKTATDTLQVNVITDPPSIRVDDNDGVISRKVNAKYKFEYTAKDKYGTIQEVAWKCGNGSFNTTVISPAKKEHTDSMEIQLPNTEATNYKCIVRATDDDNQIGFDTLKFNIIKDIPVIRLNIHNKNVTIKDQEQLKYTASNTLGGTIYVDYICGGNLNNLKVSNWSSSWQGRKGETPSVVMPESAGNYYCVMRAVDEDEKDMVASAATLYSLDTVTYKVFRAPPSVTLNESYTRTIKDTLTLYANAKDSSETTLPGRIVSYEWGCGPNSDHDILSKLTNTGKNTYLVTLPNTPQNNYLCIVQVTDDDGLTARDTTRFTVELAPPTVTVSRKTGTIRAGFDIILNATDSDSY
ncbi:MAG: carboxypeptidase regulatory-like domain-containing protein, partial [Fibrobacter sp.]|nr:carboxypeptidase regulatory-like domain-containing protein [Fibrobacter sp.]